MYSRRDVLAVLAPAGGLAGLAVLPASAAEHKERLTLTTFDLFRVCPPVQDGVLANSAGPDFDKVPKFMLKVYSDSGIIGLGGPIAWGVGLVPKLS